MRKGFRTMMLAAACVLTAGPAATGDLYWSAVPGISDVWDIAVCGDTVYLAAGNGLFRSDTLPASWTLLRPGYFMIVACDGDTVLAQESAIPDVHWVSHDRGDTWAQITGLDGEDVRGLAVSGNLALAAVRNGVLRSDNGGDSFSVYPILWSSTNQWNILDVWTDGSQCVAVGEYSSGIWYSPSCATDSFSVVVDGSFTWITSDGSGIVAAERYGGSADGIAELSTDGGASWQALPLNWDGAPIAHYNLPAYANGRILGSRSDSYLDSGTGQWVYVYEGPYYYDMATGQNFGNDLGAGGFPHDAQIRSMAIVDGPQPIFFAGVDGGALFWFRLPDGWPSGPIDLTPPAPGSIGCAPRIATTTSAPSSVTLTPSSSGATQLDIVEQLLDIHADTWWTGTDYAWSWSWNDSLLADTGWIPITSSLSQPLGSQAGIHFFHAWFADDAGNFTNPSVADGITLLPATLNLAEDHGWATVLWLHAGEQVTLGVSAPSGDADIYHWEPNSSGPPDDSMTTWSNDSLTFTARTTGGHIVLVDNYPGSGAISNGSLSVSASRAASASPGSRGDGSTQPTGDGGPGAGPDTRDWIDPAEQPADINGDGRLDGADIELLLRMLWTGTPTSSGDCTPDTQVDAADLACTTAHITQR